MFESRILCRFEFFVLVLILLSFFLFGQSKNDVPTSYSWEYFVDKNLSGGAEDGTEPTDAWKSLDDIDWNVLNYGDVVYVRSYGTSAYTLTNPITPTDSGITLRGVNTTGVVSGWGATTLTTVTNSNGSVLEVGSASAEFVIRYFVLDNTACTNGDPAVFLDAADDCEIHDCVIYGDTGMGIQSIDSNGVYIDQCQVTTVSDKGIYIEGGNEHQISNTDVTSDYGTLLELVDTDAIEIESCDFDRNETSYDEYIYLNSACNLTMYGCTTNIASGEECYDILYLDSVADCTFTKNKFHTGSGAALSAGIGLYNSCGYSTFNCNSIYGEFQAYAVCDFYSTGGIGYINNTINNTYSSGKGFYGARDNINYTCAISAFKNNVISVNSTSYIIMLFNAAYFKGLTAGVMDHNCYYNGNGAGKFGYWSSYDVNTIAAWKALTGGANSASGNPQFAADGYTLTSSSSTAVTEGGINIDASDTDFDGFLRPPTSSGKVSKGVDQAPAITYSGSFWATPNSISFGTLSYEPSTTLSIYAWGKTIITVSGITITGTNPSNFYFSPAFTSSFTIPSNGTAYSLTVGVQNTSAPNSYAASLDITHDGCFTGTTTDNIALSFTRS